MTAEQQIFAALSPILAVYPEHLPVDAPLPALVYQRVGGVSGNTNCILAWQPEMRLCVFASTPQQRALLIGQIQAAAHNALWLPEDVLVCEYDYDTKAYCAIWSYLLDE